MRPSDHSIATVGYDSSLFKLTFKLVYPAAAFPPPTEVGGLLAAFLYEQPLESKRKQARIGTCPTRVETTERILYQH